MLFPWKVVASATLICLSGQLSPAQTAPTPATSPHDPQLHDTQLHIEKVHSCLTQAVVIKDDPHACHTLKEEMVALHVNGVSVAVVHNGTLEWAQGFGVQQVGGGPVTANTLFQAGSISKPVAAMAALHLVQQGKLSLNADVNTVLTSWKVPPSPAAPGATVTLRELLTHTA